MDKSRRSVDTSALTRAPPNSPGDREHRRMVRPEHFQRARLVLGWSRHRWAGDGFEPCGHASLLHKSSSARKGDGRIWGEGVFFRKKLWRQQSLAWTAGVDERGRMAGAA